MELKKHTKTAIKDQEVTANVIGEDLSQNELLRVFAVNIQFTDVVFKQCNITSSYFRNCRFIRCDFTGAIFKDTNLRGSQFEECKFVYTTWEKTLLDETFLETCLPSEENLARDLVRSLRVNFSQVGNYEAVNKAASIEVKLTGQHLFNAAYSKQSYYRSKYKGFTRVQYGFRHAKWKALDLLWGNGESVLRVAGWAVLTVTLIAIAISFSEPLRGITNVLGTAVSIFCGVRPQQDVHPAFVVVATVIRFFLFGLFMAILVKRLSRR
jgi:uncharacterized protein YjbI with pentapeptide repeats